MTGQTSVEGDLDLNDAEVSADADATADAGGEAIGILEVREQVMDIADTLLDQPFDGITTVEPIDESGWRAVFEVVERSAVPDTQDVIGRYELLLSQTGEVQEYSLQKRFKRSELQGESI